MPQREEVELRGQCPKEVVDVLDAISLARGISRAQLVNVILAEWARDRQREASVLLKVARGNPSSLDT